MNTRKMNMKWHGVELDDAEPRKRFRRALMRAAAEFRSHKRDTASVFTPFWRSEFTDWMVYDGTIEPCGVRVESVTPDTVTFEANCAGVQTEGICLSVTFEIPTSEFTRAQLKAMVHDFEYDPTTVLANGRKTYGPFENTEYATLCEWWYDDSYDEEDQDEEDEEVV